MSRKPLLAALCIAGSILLFGWYYSARPAKPPAPRRVIWIAIDSLRADRVGFGGYGRGTSPWLDGIAAQSVNYTWAVSPGNETAISVASYFTGKPYSANIGRLDPQHLVPEDEVTLAEALASAGVRALAYSAHPTVPRDSGYGQGFEAVHLVATPAKDLASIDEVIHAVKDTYVQSSAREFIYVHTMDVHYPYRTPYPYGATFAPGYSGGNVREGQIPVPERNEAHLRSIFPHWNQFRDIKDEDITFLRGLYDGAIRYTDDKLPQLLAALGWDPARDVLIISADHGEQIFEKGWWGHFATLSPVECHVPLLVHSPHFPARRVEEAVSLMDLYPTILDLFGVAPGSNTYAATLLPSLRGEAAPRGTAYSESQPWNGMAAAWISGDHWYWMQGNRSRLEPWQLWPYHEALYRFREDPAFDRDLSANQSELAAEMNRALRNYHPRWSSFTSDRMRGDETKIRIGENRLQLLVDPAGLSRTTSVDGAWVFDTTQASLVYRAEGLAARDAILFELPYRLDSGRIRIRISNIDRDALNPWARGANEWWQFDAARPTAGIESLRFPLVASKESVEVHIDVAPGTKALIQPPTIRRMEFDRIVPLSAEQPIATVLDDEDITAAERERLESLGYR